jgi:hypothetical protein
MIRSSAGSDKGNGIFEYLYPVAYDLLVIFPGALIAFLQSGPVRVVGDMVVGFRVRHQTEDASGRIADAGNVRQ